MDRCVVGRLGLHGTPTPSGLRVGYVAGHQVVVGDHYDDDTLGVFIPAGATVPDKIAEEMWVKGRLAGKRKDRVKERIVDGALSEGLFYGSRYFVESDHVRTYHDGPSWQSVWAEGQDVTRELGVTFKGDTP